MNQSNVIFFPLRRHISRLKTETLVHLDQEQRRVIVSAIMLSILFFVTLMNDSILSHPDAVVPMRASRSIASEGVATLSAQRNDKWDQIMANRLAQDSVENGSAASFGTAPNELDHFIYGTLSGSYAVRTYHGAIQELEFVAAQNSAPTKVHDGKSFLNDGEIRKVLPVRYETAVKIAERTESQTRWQTFALLDASNKSVARVNLELDHSNELLSLKIDQ